MPVWKGVKEVCQKFTENIEQKQDGRLNSNSEVDMHGKDQRKNSKRLFLRLLMLQFLLSSWGSSTGTSPLTLSLSEILLEIKRTIRYRRTEFREPKIQLPQTCLFFPLQMCYNPVSPALKHDITLNSAKLSYE